MGYEFFFLVWSAQTNRMFFFSNNYSLVAMGTCKEFSKIANRILVMAKVCIATSAIILAR